MQADSHSKCVLLRDLVVLGGGLDCLFGEVVLICMSNLHSILMNNEHLKKMGQKYSFFYIAQQFRC